MTDPRFAECSLRKLILPAILTLALSLSSCGGKLIDSFTSLNRLQAEISKRFNETNVSVNLMNDKVLTITFINSPLNSKEAQDRAVRAQQTASYVKDHYPAVKSITEIWIRFVKQETRYVVVTYTEDKDWFGFDNNARVLDSADPLVPADPESDNRLYPHVTYSTQRQQSDVSITQIELEGNLDDGVMMVPHFTVEGDATGIRKAPAPATVSIDFASYSSTSRFPGATRIEFLGDGKPVHQMNEQFHTTKTPNDKYSEFLLIQIPFKVFRKWTTARDVKLNLGTKEYSFTPEQVRVMREMSEIVAR